MQQVRGDERVPRPVAQRGRSDYQHPLAAVLHRLSDQFSGQESLAQPDLIGNQHAVALLQDAPGPPKSVGLERREVDLRGALGGGLCLQLLAVELPQHPQIHELGQMGLETGLKQGSQVVVGGLGPQLLEPIPHLAHHMGRVVAQVQLQVGGQTREGEVGRPGHHSVRAIPHQEGLAVQEPPLQAADLNRLRAQPLHQPPGSGMDLEREAQMVALNEQVLLVALQRLAQPGAGRPMRIGRLRAQCPPTALRRHRLSPQQQPHTGCLLQRISQQRISAYVEIRSGDVQTSPAHKPSSSMRDEPVQRRSHRLFTPVDGQLRLLRNGHAAS